MKSTCSHCGSTQQVPEEYAGQPIKCVVCKSEFVAGKLHPSDRSASVRPAMRIAVGISGTVIGAIFKTIGAMIIAIITVAVIICTLGGLADLPGGGFGGIQFLLGIIALCQIAQFVKNIL